MSLATIFIVGWLHIARTAAEAATELAEDPIRFGPSSP
jgi:hypothetical protein